MIKEKYRQSGENLKLSQRTKYLPFLITALACSHTWRLRRKSNLESPTVGEISILIKRVFLYKVLFDQSRMVENWSTFILNIPNCWREFLIISVQYNKINKYIMKFKNISKIRRFLINRSHLSLFFYFFLFFVSKKFCLVLLTVN